MKVSMALISICNLFCTIAILLNIPSEIRIITIVILTLELIIFLKPVEKRYMAVGIISYCILLYITITNFVVDYQFFAQWNGIVAFAMALIYSLLTLITMKNNPNKNVLLIIYLIFSFFSFLSILSIANVELDNKNIEIYKVNICDKGYTQVYSFNPRFEFLLKGEIQGSEYWISVPYETYKTVELGTNVDVCVGEGFFNNKYYYYKDCKYAEYFIDKRIVINDESFYEYINSQKKI